MARRKVNRPTKKKLLTIDDLYSFYLEQNKTCKFSSEESGYQLSIQVPAYFEVSDEEDDTLLFCTVKLMHSGENRNHSNVTDEALTKAAKGLAYKPILANFMEYTDEKTGETLKDFTSHDMVINDDGTATYLEKQVGCFTADAPYFEVEEETGRNFLYGICAIPREYTDTCSIIERKNGTKISVELAVNSMEFDASKKVLNLTDVVILGATLLGKDPKTLKDVGEGMKNARLDIADFSTKNNSVKFTKDDKLIELLENLNKTLSNFNKEQNSVQTLSKEGGNDKNMDKFNELLEKYGKTAEDIDFEYEDMTDDELESKFEEVFGKLEDNSTSEPSNDEGTDDGDESEENPEVKEDNACGGGGSGATKKKKKNSAENEPMTRTYEISHDDIRYALYNLLVPYEESDNEWYCITGVYDSYFVYESWSGGKIYGQKYTKDNDNVSFDGERYTLHKEYLNDSEYTELQSMRSNYASLKEFKETTEKNELHAKREEILNSEKYVAVSETEAFKELVKNMDNYSLEELEKEAKIIFADNFNVKSFAVHAEKAQKNSTVKVFANVNKSKKDSRYGDLFSK